jgi:hypothetical protein
MKAAPRRMLPPLIKLESSADLAPQIKCKLFTPSI